MATEKKTITTNGRRAGKVTQQKAAIDTAVSEGKTVRVRSKEGDTIHAPGRKPRTVPPGTAAKKAPAKKTAGKGGAQGKASSKVPPKGKAAPTPAVTAHEAQKAATEHASPGQPTLYRPEYCAQLISFFRIELERTVDVTKPDGKGGVTTVTETIINKFPTLTRFADSIDVTRQTLHNWATATNAEGTHLHPEFFYAYTRAKDLQESLLIEGGMAGAWDSRFATIASKNLIGWRDQIEQKVENTFTATKAEDLDAVYQRGIEAAELARQEALNREIPVNDPNRDA